MSDNTRTIPAGLQGCHTSLEGTDTFASMLIGIGEGVTDVITHALSYVSLDMEQGFRVYSAVLKVILELERNELQYYYKLMLPNVFRLDT